MIRLIDIAREAGVSRPQVSAVLGGKPSTIGVAPEKAREIRAIAERLQYRPNMLARALRGKSSKSIGVLIDSHASLSIFRQMAELEGLFGQQGYRLLIGEAHDDLNAHWENYVSLRQYGVDGVLCLSHDYPGENDRLAQHFALEEDIVFIGLPLVGKHPVIYSDTAEGIRLAARHLLSSGSRLPGLICLNTGRVVMSERQRGFLDICPGSAERIHLIPANQMGLGNESNLAMDAIRDLILQKGCDSLIIYNDLFAIRVLNGLRQIGKAVPEQIAVIGQDNEPFGECSTPSLTTIDPMHAALAKKSVDIMLSLLNHRHVPQCSVITPQLIVRGSSFIPKQEKQQ